jgi:hypothetical protein
MFQSSVNFQQNIYNLYSHVHFEKLPVTIYFPSLSIPVIKSRPYVVQFSNFQLKLQND